MKTIEEIITYLEYEVKAAHEAHDETKDPKERLMHLIRIATIEELIAEIKR